MTSLTQKQIAQVLDRAAGRSAYPSTGKQNWYLAGLWLKAGTAEINYQDFLLDSSAALSKDMASDLIGIAIRDAAKAA